MADETYTIDTSKAQADLKRLAEAMDKASLAAGNMDKKMSHAVTANDQAFARASRNMEKFAMVANQVSKIRLSGDPAKAVTEFSNALTKLGRAKSFDVAKLQGLRDLAKIMPTLRAPAGSRGIVQFMNGLGAARAPSASTITRFNDLFKVLAKYQPTSATRQNAGLRQLFDTIASIRVPSAAAIGRLEQMFRVLGSAKQIPGAQRIAADLDHIAAAAARAGAALNTLPPRMRGLGAPLVAASRNTRSFNNEIGRTESHTKRGVRGMVSFGGELGKLNNRFKLTYQAGTLVNAMFAAFTVGTFLKGVYDTGVAFQKLEKSMLFISGTFAGAKKATADYLKLSNDLGANALANADAFGRFAISAGAAGLSTEATMKVYKGTQLALTAIGATTQQSSLAFYGLSQMMAKGKVSSEEFNRQIGEQIPGNIMAGVKALTKLTGKTQSAASFFDAMRKGAIQSKPFVALWAQELENMFSALLPLAEKRPDFQLNRLLNSFNVFKKGVGDAGFIGAITFEFKRFADMLTDKDGNLTAKAQKLADSIGKGLGKAVHTLGNGLAWLVDHLDQVVVALKGVAAFAIGSTLMGWGRSAITAAQGFQQLLTQVSGLEKKFATGGAARALAATPGASAIPIPLSGSTSNIIARRGREGGTQPGFAYGSGFQPAGTFGRRQFNDIPRSTAPTMQRAAAGFKMADVAAKGMAGSLGAARVALNVLPGLFLAAGVAALVFGDRLVEMQGKTVKVMDIALGAVDYVGDSIVASVASMASSFSGLDEAGKPIKNLGDLILDMAAGFVYASRIVFTGAKAMGTIFGGLLANIIVPFAAGMVALGKGDFAGVLREVGDVVGGKYLQDAWGDAYKMSTDAVGSYDEIRSGIGQRAGASAANRAGTPNDAAMSREALEARRRIEEEMQARQREDAKLEREALVAAMERRDRLAEFGAPTLAEVFARIEKATSAAAKATGEAAKTTADAARTLTGGSGGTHSYGALSAAYGTAGSGGAGQWATGATARQKSFNLIAGFEGYRSKAYWDVNHYRVGYGSDTFTDAGGKIGKVNKNTVVNPEMAQADLYRRVDQFAALAERTIGSAWAGLSDGAKAAITSVTYNYGRTPAAVAAAAKTGDASKLAAAVDALGVHNGGVNRTRRAREAAVIRGQSTIGAAGTPSGGGMGGGIASDSEEERLSVQYLNLQKSFNSLVRPGSPEYEATSNYANYLIELEKLAGRFETLKDKNDGQLRDLFDRDKIQSTADMYIRKIEEAKDPTLKLARETENAAKVSDLRMKGMSDEADFQEFLNGLLEDSAEYKALDNAATRASYKATMDRNRALKSQADLMDEINSIEVSRRQRQGSAFDGVYADLVNSAYTDGDFASKMSRASGDPNIAARANAIVGARKSEGTDSVRNQMRELLTTSKMSESALAWRDDYKSFLEAASGIQRDTLGELERDTDAAAQAFAKNAADIKKTIENPPGFQRWADSLAPVAERLEDIKAGFAESLSSGITDALMGDDVDWTAMFRDLNKQVLKVHVDEMLKGMIGGGNSLMGKLFGKEAGDPLAALGAPEQALTTSAGTLQTAGTMLQQAATSLSTAVAAASASPGGVAGAPGNWSPADLSGLQPVGSGLASIASMSANDNAPLAKMLVDQTGGAGFQSSADRMAGLNAAFSAGSPAKGGMGSILGALNGGQGFLGGLGNMGKIAALSWLGRKLTKKKKPEKAYEVLPVNGVLGEYGGVDVSGTAVDAKANKTGSILGAVANLALSSFMPGGAGMFGGGKGLQSIVNKSIAANPGLFSEGGLSTHPVGRMPASFWTSAPAYSEGTPNTSMGVGIPAVLHPDEAVIPLTRGRKIPIEGGNMGGGQNIVMRTNMTIVANDPNAFRASESAIQRRINRQQKRAQLRNLNA